MGLPQRARRLFYRARRALVGGADHEPVVQIEHEDAGAARPIPSRLRQAIGRWAHTAAAFVATFAVMALIYAASVAWRERVVLPLAPPNAEGPPSGSRAVAVAASLLALENLDPAREAWFAPRARKQRIAAMQEGASEAVGAFIEVVERRRAGRDKDLARAAAALDDEEFAPPVRYVTARDALRRFNDRAGRRGPPIDRGANAFAALSRAAAAAVQSHARALAILGDKAHAGAIVGRGRREFYRARGEAYAWRLLIAAYRGDMNAPAGGFASSPYAAADRALAATADYEPLFLATPLFGRRNPLRSLARRLDAARAPLNTLAAVSAPQR